MYLGMLQEMTIHLQIIMDYSLSSKYDKLGFEKLPINPFHTAINKYSSFSSAELLVNKILSIQIKIEEFRLQIIITRASVVGDSAGDDEYAGAYRSADAEEYEVKHAEATDEAVAGVRAHGNFQWRAQGFGP